MDITLIIRVAFAVVIGGVLIMQARQMTSQPNRRRAFYFGAAALACFTVFNVSIGMNASFGAFQQITAVVGVALFVAAAVSLVLALRAGETSADRQRMAEEIQAFSKKREQTKEKEEHRKE
jgi:putative Ca2+/H+ antiporter (TMEM165/GDT1 family)